MTRTWDDVGIDSSLLRNPDGEQKIPCPKCGPTAKRPSKTDLSVNTATGEWNCWNDGKGCGFKGNLNAFSAPKGSVVSSKGRDGSNYRKISKDQYLKQTEPLPQEALDWLEARGFDADLANRCGLRWGVITKEHEQWIKGIYYPYLINRDGDTYIANIKKRCLCCKTHMQLVGREKGTDLPAELVFYGLTNVADTTIFCEGELDAMAYWQAGITNAVSVPNGATLKSDTAGLNYLDTCKREIDRVKHAIMSVDDDQPGRLLKNELARRIGFERCSYVVYPEGCKDANDVLLKYGSDRLKLMIEEAKPFPTSGIARPLDSLETFREWRIDGKPRGVSTGWSELDKFYQPLPGQLNIVTGVPSHGKTAWVFALIVNLWRLHHWRSIIFSPENCPVDFLHSQLAELMIGKVQDPVDLKNWTDLGFTGELMSDEEMEGVLNNIQNGFSTILPEINGEGHSLEQLLDIAEAEIYRFGAKVMVIDPFNEIEHHIPKGMAKTDYIGLSLMKLRRFARHHGINVYIVAHPTKMERRPEKFKDDDGKETILMTEPIPTAYDIADSSNWFNKADNVITVWRDKYAAIRGNDPHLNTISVQKVKFKWTGRPGAIQLRWDPPTGRYLPPDGETDSDMTEINQILGDDW